MQQYSNKIDRCCQRSSANKSMIHCVYSLDWKGRGGGLTKLNKFVCPSVWLFLSLGQKNIAGKDTSCDKFRCRELESEVRSPRSSSVDRDPSNSSLRETSFSETSRCGKLEIQFSWSRKLDVNDSGWIFSCGAQREYCDYYRLRKKFMRRVKIMIFMQEFIQKQQKLSFEIKIIIAHDLLRTICKLSDLVKVPLLRLWIEKFLTCFFNFIEWLKSATFHKVLHWSE